MTQSFGFWDILISSSFAAAGPVMYAVKAARHAADRSRLRIKVLLRTPSSDGPSAPAVEDRQETAPCQKGFQFEKFSASPCHLGEVTDGVSCGHSPCLHRG